MTQEKLKYANDLNDKLYDCKILSEVFSEYTLGMFIELRSEDRSCTIRRCSYLPEDLLNEIIDTIDKYVSNLESEFEKL